MSIKEYKVPKILFIKSVFLKDCIQIDDIFEQRILDQLGTSEYVQVYEKIPSTFTNMKSWLKKVNIKCWYCDLDFTSVPVFIPKIIDVKSADVYNISTCGCFCSFSCAGAYNNTYNTKICDNINVTEMLLFLYKVFNNKVIKEILPSPSKYIMEHYGGNTPITEYRLKLKELQVKMSSIEL